MDSPPPTQLPGQYSPVWPRLCFCFPVWSPWSCRAVAVPMGHGRGSSSPRGCARLGLQPLPLHRAAKGAGGEGARDPPGLKHPPPPPVQERCIPLCQSCSRCQWHSHGPEQLHRTGTPFVPLNRARTSLGGGGKWVWGEGTPLRRPLLLVACLQCQDRVSAPGQGVVARPCVPARAPGWQGGGQRWQLPWGTACDRSPPCILLHHPPARQVGQVAESSPPKIPPTPSKSEMRRS